MCLHSIVPITISLRPATTTTTLNIHPFDLNYHPFSDFASPFPRQPGKHTLCAPLLYRVITYFEVGQEGGEKWKEWRIFKGAREPPSAGNIFL